MKRVGAQKRNVDSVGLPGSKGPLDSAGSSLSVGLTLGFPDYSVVNDYFKDELRDKTNLAGGHQTTLNHDQTATMTDRSGKNKKECNPTRRAMFEKCQKKDEGDDDDDEKKDGEDMGTEFQEALEILTQMRASSGSEYCEDVKKLKKKCKQEWEDERNDDRSWVTKKIEWKSKNQDLPDMTPQKQDATAGQDDACNSACEDRLKTQEAKVRKSKQVKHVVNRGVEHLSIPKSSK
jgi:hypothetical protein